MGLNKQNIHTLLMEIKNKVVIVTGASSGIGLATAKLLAQNGAKVALVSRSKEKLKIISSWIPGSFAISADMSNESDIKKMVEEAQAHFGKIDILINNAGQGYDASVEKTDMQKFRSLFELNVAGPFIAMQNVIPIMRKQGGGMIINISSGTALMHLPNMAAYSSLKRALAGISLTAREELAKDKIIVSVVYPYITLTDFEKNTVKGEDAKERYEKEENSAEANSQSSSRPPPDTAEYVAQKILDGIKSEEAEIFVHDWMKNLGKK